MEKKELNIAIGKRIRTERERAGLTREQLAELVDITSRFVADIERGSVGISVPTLRKICEVLNISSDSLLWGKTSQTSIDERLKFVDEDYIRIIDKTVQSQLDLIELIKSKS